MGLPRGGTEARIAVVHGIASQTSQAAPKSPERGRGGQQEIEKFQEIVGTWHYNALFLEQCFEVLLRGLLTVIANLIPEGRLGFADSPYYS
jgi:hypothetical protein